MEFTKTSSKFYWTKHSKEKMKFYNLSEAKLKKVLRKPDRKELGIAPKTLAVMQRAGSKRNPYEIWLMYQKINYKESNSKQKGKIIKIISVWRYPGKSQEREGPPIPEDILWELKL